MRPTLQDAGWIAFGTVYLALILEKACWMQLVAESAGGAKLVTSPEEAKAKKRITRAENQINLFNYLVRRVSRQR